MKRIETSRLIQIHTSTSWSNNYYGIYWEQFIQGSSSVTLWTCIRKVSTLNPFPDDFKTILFLYTNNGVSWLNSNRNSYLFFLIVQRFECSFGVRSTNECLLCDYLICPFSQPVWVQTRRYESVLSCRYQARSQNCQKRLLKSSCLQCRQNGGGRGRKLIRIPGARLCCICLCFSLSYYCLSIVQFNGFSPSPSHCNWVCLSNIV